MNQLFYKSDIILSNLSFSKSIESLHMHFNDFIAPSACVHKIMEHADDLSKMLNWNYVTLLVTF